MNFLYRNNLKSFFFLYGCWISYNLLSWISGAFIYNSLSIETILDHLQDSLLFGWVQFVLIYWVAYVIIPRYFQRQQITKFIIFCLVALAGYSIVRYFLFSIVRPESLQLYRETENGPRVRIPFMVFFSANFIGALPSLLIAFAYRYLVDWLLFEKKQLTLEKEKSEAQLSFLKSQINAHFLFNTLNNIYSLALKQSEETPTSILKLSDMMRYMLYEQESADGKVDLEKEISYIRNYIELQQLQSNNKLSLDFIVRGETRNKRISQLILVPFIENAFKHGKRNDKEHPIQILLVVEGEKLIFRVINHKQLENKDEQGGVGIVNVKNRLQLEYPGKYELKISEDGDIYSITMTILLSGDDKI